MAREAAAAAAETARRTFGEGGIGDELPTIEVPRDELERGIAAFELLRRAGLAASNGEARRLIKGGGGRLNDRAVESETQLVTLADLLADGRDQAVGGQEAPRPGEAGLGACVGNGPVGWFGGERRVASKLGHGLTLGLLRA